MSAEQPTAPETPAPPDTPPADEPRPEPSTAPPGAETMASPQLGGVTEDERARQARESATAGPGYVSAYPLLTTGAYGPIVAELARLLDQAGYPNAVVAGTAEPILTDDLMRQVREFQQAQGIDPAGPQRGFDADGPAAAPLVRKDHEGLVEAHTWAALYDAAGGEELDLAVTRRHGALELLAELRA